MGRFIEKVPAAPDMRGKQKMKCGKKISLQMSLLMIICISMIPVNLLLLHSSNRAVKNVQVRLEESYANEAKDSWTSLSAMDGSGVLEQQNLINHLKNIWQRQELLQGGYLKMDAKEYVSVTYDSSEVLWSSQDVFLFLRRKKYCSSRCSFVNGVVAACSAFLKR